MADPPVKRKRMIACDVCRERKVRCTGEIPCQNCIGRGDYCTIAQSKRTITRPANDPVNQRLDRLETLILAQHEELHDATQSKLIATPTNSPTSWPKFVRNDATNAQAGPEDRPNSAAPPNAETDRMKPPRLAISDKEYEDSRLFMLDMTDLEYAGSSSFLSACSKPAVDYVSRAIGNNGYQVAASRFQKDMLDRVNSSGSIASVGQPDPSQEDAWRYVNAHFESAPDAMHGVALRARFEANLRSYFAGGVVVNDNRAWAALRDTIFASGCRIYESQRCAYKDAVERSWKWFENALAMLSDLVFFRPSLLGAQALVVMGFYAEAVSVPSVRFMLSSCALRLCCAKGLHRQPSPSWNLSEDEICHRGWVFWSAYCLEKYVSLRTGRPSALHDSEITCQIPNTAPEGNGMDIWCSQLIIKFSQLLSSISKLASSASRQSAHDIVQAVQSLHIKAEQLKQAAMSKIDLAKPLNTFELKGGLTSASALRLLGLYYEVMLRLHSRLALPWFRASCPDLLQQEHEEVIAWSVALYTETARSAILTCSQVRPDANCTLSFAISIPVAACIAIFCHIIGYPLDPKTQSDLSLLDICAGHFARFAFASESAVSITFVAELAQLARNRCSSIGNASSSAPAGGSSTVPVTAPPTPPGKASASVNVGRDDALSTDWFADVDLEAWSTVFPFDYVYDDGGGQMYP